MPPTARGATVEADTKEVSTLTMLEKWSPTLPDLDLFERRARRLFEELGVAPAITPAANVYESDEEMVVELEVPGFGEKELSVEVTDHTLTVTGKRAEETPKPGKTVRYQGRLEATFERRIQLPADTDPEHAVAEYEKGVLELHVPKLDGAKRKAIKVTSR